MRLRMTLGSKGLFAWKRYVFIDNETMPSDIDACGYLICKMRRYECWRNVTCGSFSRLVAIR